MGLNFSDIILEGTDKRSEKFIQLLLPKMKEYFEAHDSLHWTDAASFMDTQTVEKYRGYMINAKEKGKEMSEILEKLNNFDSHTPKNLNKLQNRYFRLNKEFNESLTNVAHIKNLFNDMGIGNHENFIDKYAVPIGVLVDVWERFYNDVYKPSKIENNKSMGDLKLSYGLPKRDYGKITFIDSMLGEKRYLTMKDNKLNDYILGVNIGWEWRDGLDVEKLYYKPFNTKDDVKRALTDFEFDNLMNELKGAEVNYTEEEVKNSYDYFLKNISKVKKVAEDSYSGSIPNALSELLDYDSIVDGNHNFYSSDVHTLSRYLINYYDIIQGFNF